MNKPVKKLRQGRLNTSIWKATTHSGETFHTVSIERRYQDRQGEWKTAHTYTRKDLAELILLLANTASAIDDLESDKTTAGSVQQVAKPPTPSQHGNP